MAPASVRRLVAQIDALHSTTESIVRSETLDSIYVAALNGLRNALGASRVAILLFEPPTPEGTMRFAADLGLSESYKKAVGGHTPWAFEAVDARPMLIDDVAAEPSLRPYLSAIRAEGIGAMAFVPLIGERGVIGKFMLYYDAARPFEPTDALLAQTIAQQVAFAVERRRAEAELIRQKSLLEAQTQAAADGILVVDESGQIVSFNRRFVDLWQIPPDVVATRSDEKAIQSVLALLVDPASFVWLVRYLYEHQDERSNDVLLLKDGRTFERFSAPVRSDTGQYFGRVWFFRDVTDRARAEETRLRLLEQEKAARAEAEEASRAKDDFLATLSHELRTPVNAVLGWTQVLQKAEVDEAARQRALAAIHRNALLQSQLISDILDVSGIIQGRLPFSFQRASIPPLIFDVLDSVAAMATAKGVVIDATVDPDVGVNVVDAGRFQQVLWNLLSNAIKFSAAGGAVRVRVHQQSDTMTVTVADDGVGIAPDFLPHVFERYQQGHPSTRRGYGGLGLGLAIVKYIVEKHGGSVAAGSDGEGTGATFTITLPVRAQMDDLVPDAMVGTPAVDGEPT